MKKIGWSILITLFTIVSLNAQEKETDLVDSPKNIVKIFPLQLLSANLGLGYERVIKPKTSLNFTAFIQQFNRANFDTNEFDSNYSLFFETDLRRYLSKKKNIPEGFFIGGGAFGLYNNDEFNNSDINENNERVETLWVAATAKVGHQWIFKKALKGISTEVNATLDYRTALGIFDNDAESAIGLHFRFTIGYSW